jgi:hypothetical protein
MATALFLVGPVVIHSSDAPGAQGPHRGSQHLTPLTLKANGETDPLITFQQWRDKNRVTLPVTASAWRAHVQWQRLHNIPQIPAATGATRSGIVPESATVGTNVCPNGGVSNYQGEISIAVNPNDPNQLVAGANTWNADCSGDATQALYGSADGGATWPNYACAPEPSTGFFGSDPSAAWDANNNAWMAYMLINGSSETAIVVAKSTDVGASWSLVGYVVNDLSNPSSFDDKDMLAIDTTSGQAHSHTNRLYVIWDTNNTERVAYSDNGTSWTTVVVEDGAHSGNDIGGDLAIGPDGTVYATWDRLPGSGDTHAFSKSTDGGATWSAPVQIASGTLASFGSHYPPAQDQRGINAFGAIAVDCDPASPYMGTVYVVYPDFPASPSGWDTNIYLIKSTDGGSTWSAPLKVNDDADGPTHFFPWVAVDQSSGSVNVSWYDTRNNAPAYTQTQMFFSQSTDGGATFSPNVQITQASNQFSNSSIAYSDENSTDNPNYNPNQYGDYHQICAAPGVAHIGWTDTRQFYPSNTSNPLAEDFATASVTLSSCSQPSTPTGLIATGTVSAVNLSWNAVSGATYNILRGASCGAVAQIGTSATNSYSDTTASAGVIYYYAVQAVVGGCASNNSACVTGSLTSTYNLSFQDDYGRSDLCVNSTTGGWQYTVLKGNGAGNVYTGTGTVVNGTGYMRLTATPGSGYGLTLIYYTTAQRATATFTYRPDAVSSALYDRNTLDDLPCGGGNPD